MKYEWMLWVVRCLLSLAWVDWCICISFNKTNAFCIVCMHKFTKAALGHRCKSFNWHFALHLSGKLRCKSKCLWFILILKLWGLKPQSCLHLDRRRVHAAFAEWQLHKAVAALTMVIQQKHDRAVTSVCVSWLFSSLRSCGTFSVPSSFSGHEACFHLQHSPLTQALSTASNPCCQSGRLMPAALLLWPWWHWWTGSLVNRPFFAATCSLPVGPPTFCKL